MGTIGHRTLLYDLKRWQVYAALRGYYRQQRPTYEAARLLGLWTVSCQRTKEAPALELEDLIRFPWDERDSGSMPTDEEIERLKQLIAEENERLAAERKVNP